MRKIQIIVIITSIITSIIALVFMATAVVQAIVANTMLYEQSTSELNATVTFFYYGSNSSLIISFLWFIFAIISISQFPVEHYENYKINVDNREQFNEYIEKMTDDIEKSFDFIILSFKCSILWGFAGLLSAVLMYNF